MNTGYVAAGLLACALISPAQKIVLNGPMQSDFGNHDGWTSLFDGKTLTGWEGDPQVWKVQDGVIVGHYDTAAGTRDGQTFLLLKDRQPRNFELKLEIKLEGAAADSGIQYRSFLVAPRAGSFPPERNQQWNLGGYQFDFHYIPSYNGQIAEGGPLGRGIIAKPGQMVRTQTGQLPLLVAQMGSLEEAGRSYHQGEWNQVQIIAQGHEIVQIINGRVMSVLIDDDESKVKLQGLIGLQCAGLGTVKISFRNLWMKEAKD